MEHYESGSENGYGMDYYGGNGTSLFNRIPVETVHAHKFY